MDKTNEAKPKKKGLFAILKESMTKMGQGCGPGCGCHNDETDKKKAGPDAQPDEKRK